MDKIKTIRSESYNFVFNTETGEFSRWGKTWDDDPDCAPAPEILDLEIFSGYCSGNCCFCYKENNSDKSSKYMSLDKFQILLSKFNLDILTQIAFGICDINSLMWGIFQHCRDMGVVPNYTCNGFYVDEEVAKKTKELCGAVAVSIVDKEQSFKAINHFLNAGMTQVNIHYMLSLETYEAAFELINEIAERLPNLNAIVFLQYKPKGSGVGHFHSIQGVEQYQKLIEHCIEKKVDFGFDSCSAPLFMKVAAALGNTEWLHYAEPCESGIFSSYVNVDGEFFPCSFCEGTPGWETGINVFEHDSFANVWNHPRVIEWRSTLLNSSNGCTSCSIKGCRSCPVYDLAPCKLA